MMLPDGRISLGFGDASYFKVILCNAQDGVDFV